MKVIANKTLYGSYGQVRQDQEFDCPEEKAQALLKSGYVRHATPPAVQYETKVVTPEAPEVSPREPFRDSTVHHQESAPVVDESYHGLSSASLSQPGDANPRGRRRRSVSDSE